MFCLGRRCFNLKVIRHLQLRSLVSGLFEIHPCNAAIAPTYGQQGCKEVFVVERYA